MIKIIVDCFGGDHCPEAPVEAAVKSLAANLDLHLILTGDETILRKCLEGKSYDASRLEIEHAPEVIGCDEKPTDVVRLKRNSSMMKGIIMLRDRDDIAAMVSTGSTGALVTGALVRLGRVPGQRDRLGKLFGAHALDLGQAENLGQDQNDGDEHHDQEQGLEVEACDMAVFLHKPPSPLRRCSRTLPASVVMRS